MPTPGRFNRKALRARIEQALRELPLSEEEIAAAAAGLFDAHLTVQAYGKFNLDSGFVDFGDKVTAVVEHFEVHGLTLQDYVRAAVKHPQLFSMKPATVIRDVETVAAYFGKCGLTLPDYLKAAVRQPSLFYQSPATVQGNIEQVASHFKKHGLRSAEYLKAAVRQPRLFCQSPATIQGNIEQVVSHFRKHGLTLPAYLRAAVLQPPLFCMSPVRLIANVEAVVQHFWGQGLRPTEYLRAAVRHPGLIAQPPASVIRNINRVIRLQEQGFVTFRGQGAAPPGGTLRPLFDFLVKKPDVFFLSASNYDLREQYVQVTGDRPAGAGLLTRPRSRIERDLARFREQAAGEYAQVLAWAEQAFGPGWRPSHRHYLVEADEEERVRHTGEQPLAIATLYTVKNGGKQRHFTVEDGRVVEHAGYKEAFGPLLVEPHPTRGFRRDGKWCPIPRYSLCSSPYDRVRPGRGFRQRFSHGPGRPSHAS
jgi:hypothetical protein